MKNMYHGIKMLLKCKNSEKKVCSTNEKIQIHFKNKDFITKNDKKVKLTSNEIKILTIKGYYLMLRGIKNYEIRIIRFF